MTRTEATHDREQAFIEHNRLCRELSEINMDPLQIGLDEKLAEISRCQARVFAADKILAA